MTSRAQELLGEALTLPADERANVAAELLASLDEPEADLATVEAEWAAEIEMRARRVVENPPAFPGKMCADALGVAPSA